MITTTTHTIEGRQITAYLDIVSAESVQGVNVIRDMFAGMRAFSVGAPRHLERALKEARIAGHRRDRRSGRGHFRRMRWWGSIMRSACRPERAGWWWCL